MLEWQAPASQDRRQAVVQMTRDRSRPHTCPPAFTGGRRWTTRCVLHSESVGIRFAAVAAGDRLAV